MQRIAEIDPKLVEELAETGCRFTHHSSIAPTGTISLSLANNASNGIEPSFAHHYSRNVIREGKKSKEKVDVYSFSIMLVEILSNSFHRIYLWVHRPYCNSILMKMVKKYAATTIPTA